MVFLTGDVHHSSLKTKEYKYISPFSELDLAKIYLDIAKEYGLKVTLFITGQCFVEENDKIKVISQYSNLEIGGHGFNAFKPLWIHRLVKVVRGSYWRSYRHQYNEIKKTLEIARKEANIKIVSWRNHCYEYDNNTPHILEKLGILVWSDTINRSFCKPLRISNSLIFLPINTIPDHSMLYHGYRTKQWVKKRNSLVYRIPRVLKNLILRKKLFYIEQGYCADEWFELLINDIKVKIKNKCVVVLNIHPVCMYLLDNFLTFRRLCEFLSQYESFFMKEGFRML